MTKRDREKLAERVYRDLRRIAWAEYMAEYRRTERGGSASREAYERYESGGKGRETRRRYRSSDRGVAAKRRVYHEFKSRNPNYWNERYARAGLLRKLQGRIR